MASETVEAVKLSALEAFTQRLLLAYRGDKRVPSGVTRKLHQALDTRNRAGYDPDSTITKAETRALLRLGDSALTLLQEKLDEVSDRSDAAARPRSN